MKALDCPVLVCLIRARAYHRWSPIGSIDCAGGTSASYCLVMLDRRVGQRPPALSQERSLLTVLRLPHYLTGLSIKDEAVEMLSKTQHLFLG